MYNFLKVGTLLSCPSQICSWYKSKIARGSEVRRSPDRDTSFMVFLIYFSHFLFYFKFLYIYPKVEDIFYISILCFMAMQFSLITQHFIKHLAWNLYTKKSLRSSEFYLLLVMSNCLVLSSQFQNCLKKDDVQTFLFSYIKLHQLS